MSSRHTGLQRGKDCFAFATQVLRERGPEGMPATELEAMLGKHKGGNEKSNKVLLIRARKNGLIFGKAGTLAVHPQNVRYFDTQAHCDACPILDRKTAEQIAIERREYQNQRRQDRKAAGIPDPKRPPRDRLARSGRTDSAAIAKNPRIPTGEPIITDRTKVTIIPTRPDPRFYVDPAHRGALMADWQAKRGEAVTC